MAGTTEIYLCRAGQALKQGRVEYSDSIGNRADAEADAVQRCKWDKGLAKIAYYAINAEGDFRIIFTYNNPNIGNDDDEPKPKKARKKAVKKRGLISRIIRAVSGSGKKKKAKSRTARKK